MPGQEPHVQHWAVRPGQRSALSCSYVIDDVTSPPSHPTGGGRWQKSGQVESSLLGGTALQVKSKTLQEQLCFAPRWAARACPQALLTPSQCTPSSTFDLPSLTDLVLASLGLGPGHNSPVLVTSSALFSGHYS